MNRSLVFTPGCDWKIDRHQHILFVKYETVTGKPESKRFDLSSETVYIVDGYKTLSFEEISKPESKLQYSIQKIVYFEKECSSMVAFSRGCGKTGILIPTKVYFDKITRTTTRFNIRGTKVGFRNDDVDARIEAFKFIDPERCWLTSQSIIDNSDRIKMINQQIAADDLGAWLKTPPEPLQLVSTKPMHFRGKTWTHPESTYGKQGHMLIVDITSKTFMREDDYLDVEVGDIMWYDDGNDGKAEPNEHGKLFVWRGLGAGWQKLSDDNGCFDTDMASSLQAKLMKSIENSKYGISFSEGADFDGDTITIIRLFEEEIKMAEKIRFDMYKPKISKVIFNEPATIVFWTDGTKTIVKCGENDDFDPEKGIAMCCMKKLLGTNKTGSNYLDRIKPAFDEAQEEWAKRIVKKEEK